MAQRQGSGSVETAHARLQLPHQPFWISIHMLQTMLHAHERFVLPSSVTPG